MRSVTGCLQYAPFTAPIPSPQPGFHPYSFSPFQDSQLPTLIVLRICFK